MASKVPLASYLFTRLHQLGVRAVHGVPGDYTLHSLDHIAPAGLKWIGTCNELNAGYAADGYARIRGLSALSTTYGVGELSAINAIAGAYAEHSPVVHIVGFPRRGAESEGRVVHHGLGELSKAGVFKEMAEAVTVLQADLGKGEAVEEKIDEALLKCVKESRPVYLEAPSDSASDFVHKGPLAKPLVRPEERNDAKQEDAAISALLAELQASRKPLIMVDGLAARMNIKSELNELARVTNIPTVAFPFGHGIISSELPNYHGVHAGKFGKLDFTSYTDDADCVLLFGSLPSDTNTLGWSALPKPKCTLSFDRKQLRIRNAITIGTESRPLHPKPLLQSLLSRFSSTSSKPFSFSAPSPPLPSPRSLYQNLPSSHPSAPIDQDTFYLRLTPHLQPNDTLILANSTACVGGRDFILPSQSTIINSAIWLSIGHMLPAALGVTLATQEKPKGERGRVILFEGDGSFQVSAQELGTIIRYRLPLVVFLINNDGYTFERWIHGMAAEYNDVAAWEYTLAPRFFGGEVLGKGTPEYPIETYSVETWGQLQRVLNESEGFKSGKGLTFVEVKMTREDVSENFKGGLELAGKMLGGDRSAGGTV
ncbi:MAG: hypothetical protein M1821_009667 [Bathelium mastoideum]|nr:MAG: hypothetical protein M1821_009667 [Bathelium mastoideum]